MLMHFRLAAAGILVVSLVALAEEPRHGIEKYVPVTTSTVVGSPDPPPPYRAQRLFPKLKIDFPICVRPQPGTDLMLMIDQHQSYGSTRIGRIRDQADCSEIETLFET